MYFAAVPCERTTHPPILLTGKLRMPFPRSFKTVFHPLIIPCFFKKADSCFPVQPFLLSLFCKLFLIFLNPFLNFLEKERAPTRCPLKTIFCIGFLMTTLITTHLLDDRIVFGVNKMVPFCIVVDIERISTPLTVL